MGDLSDPADRPLSIRERGMLCPIIHCNTGKDKRSIADHFQTFDGHKMAMDARV